MAFQPVPFVVQAVIHNKLPDEQDFLVDLAFDRQGVDPTATEMFALGDLIDVWWKGTVLPELSSTVVYNQVICSLLSTQDGLQISATSGSATGGVTTEQAPNAQAACISLRTGHRGRSFRGRNYISGVPNAEINVNRLSSGFMGAITDAYNQLVTGAVSDPTPFVWVVISRKSGGLLRPTGIVTPILSALFVDDIIDDQRRRKPGVGS